MYRILINLSSNIYSKLNLDRAKRMLLFSFPDIQFSRAIITMVPGDEYQFPFRNLLGVFYSDLPLAEIIHLLKSIESAMGRHTKDKELGRVVIDIDVLQFGDVILRKDDIEQEHIQKLLVEMDFE